jgi:O-antigen/teichoic acid export membrane protein
VVFAREAASPDPTRITQGSRVSTAVTALGCLGLGAVSIPLLPAIFGDDYAGSVRLLLVLLLGVVLGNPGSVVAWGLVALGRPELRSAGIAVAAVVNLALVLVLVPRYGAMGAAWATVAGSVVASSIALVLLSRLYAVPPRDYVRYRLGDFRRP